MSDWYWLEYVDTRCGNTLARDLVRAILVNLTDHRGLRHEWDMIDNDVQREIVDRWLGIAQRTIDKRLGYYEAPDKQEEL